jgi:microcystin degradation protein MlrC
MRVGIIGLLQESNTFVARPTALSDFEHDVLALGAAVRERFESAHHEIGGFFEGLARAGVEAVPVFAARALPSGPVTGDAFARLTAMMFDALAGAGRLDGVLAAPHGATVSESHADADGHWLAELRRRVGPRVPVIGTLDPHANLSRAMVEATDALIAYRTNPHVDQRRRGVEAATLMARALAGEVRPTQAAAFPPMAIGINCQATGEEPCRALYARADAMLDRPGVLSNSIVLGFPYADVPEMGSSTIVVTDGDGRAAQDLADELASPMWEGRRDFVGAYLDVEAALDRCAALPAGEPVCLLDTGDNVGGGSPGDGTVVAHALHRRRDQLGPAFVCLFDPPSAARAAAAGVGARVRLRAGGNADPAWGEPLEAEFTVCAVTDGRFEESQPRHGGFTRFDQGLTAVVRSDWGLWLMLTSQRMVPYSLEQLRHAGLDPAWFRVLVAKGVHAPLAAYAEVCRHVVRASTPGPTAADMTVLSYRHRRDRMFPFELDACWPARG